MQDTALGSHLPVLGNIHATGPSQDMYHLHVSGEIGMSSLKFELRAWRGLRFDGVVKL